MKLDKVEKSHELCLILLFYAIHVSSAPAQLNALLYNFFKIPWQILNLSLWAQKEWPLSSYSAPLPNVLKHIRNGSAQHPLPNARIQRPYWTEGCNTIFSPYLDSSALLDTKMGCLSSYRAPPDLNIVLLFRLTLTILVLLSSKRGATERVVNGPPILCSELSTQTPYPMFQPMMLSTPTPYARTRHLCLKRQGGWYWCWALALKTSVAYGYGLGYLFLLERKPIFTGWNEKFTLNNIHGPILRNWEL